MVAAPDGCRHAGGGRHRDAGREARAAAGHRRLATGGPGAGQHDSTYRARGGPRHHLRPPRRAAGRKQSGVESGRRAGRHATPGARSGGGAGLARAAHGTRGGKARGAIAQRRPVRAIHGQSQPVAGGRAGNQRKAARAPRGVDRAAFHPPVHRPDGLRPRARLRRSDRSVPAQDSPRRRLPAG